MPTPLTRLPALLASLVVVAAPVLAQGTVGPAPAPNAAAAAFRKVLDDDYKFRMREFPEFAANQGDHTNDDKLTDLSPEAIARRELHDRGLLAALRRIDRSKLQGQELLSYDLFLRDKEEDVAGQRLPLRRFPVNQVNGVQLGFPSTIRSMPRKTAKDYENIAARIRAFPRYLGHITDQMREGIRTGWTQPATPLRTLPAQIAAQVVDSAERSPLWEPFANLPAALPDTTKVRLRQLGREAILGSAVPALRDFQAFVERDYIPAARKADGISSVPGGSEYYQFRIRQETTLDLTPKEVHEIGLREVARIRAQMDSVVQAAGWTKSFPEWLTFLRTDPRFYYTKEEELLAGYREISKRIDGRLPELFAELPRLPYGVRSFPAYEAPAQTAARYYQGAADGTRAGYFVANLYKLDSRPKYEMEALTIHEAAPGHHLQIARAQELKELPQFRRGGGITAFVEGWALYAESLGPALGLYQDPYSKFGQLTYEMWRACRLVVDTGIHAFGWTRQQAIDYMLANTAKSEQDVTVEVDRYIVWPGQALAYKLGELRFQEIRRKAERELGAKFDVRRFHNALIDNGPLPLDVLTRVMDEWIARQK
ncbi:MAG: DUF885 domain-containing protein [Gemmatimonadales bacterium]|nr:DUF885 domain-containing protein [Gemmatimonadales bacterium]